MPRLEFFDKEKDGWVFYCFLPYGSNNPEYLRQIVYPYYNDTVIELWCFANRMLRTDSDKWRINGNMEN